MDVTERIAAGVVGAQFPELAPVRASYLNEGCDSAAFVVNDTWIFRFPKRRDIEQQLLVEIRVLSWLEERSPLRVPAFRFHGQPSANFPFGFAGYARIPGDPAIQTRATASPTMRSRPQWDVFSRGYTRFRRRGRAALASPSMGLTRW